MPDIGSSQVKSGRPPLSVDSATPGGVQTQRTGYSENGTDQTAGRQAIIAAAVIC
jgi:hypothetical protein